ncbi:GNAT family N-acetyltransferase [Streptomyces wuyuanensis]|uniref:GNAT family N-acetyltransferase n=1 Tax=Streptomyces wuyuanensis TaxID=1196353 RepID=UPI0037239409
MGHPAETLRHEMAVLRRWRVGDVEALDRAFVEARHHLLPWMPWAEHEGRQETVDFLHRAEKQWDVGAAYEYAITTDGSLVGGCGLMPRIGPGGLDIGYWLHPRWTGRGLATMAVTALVRQAFALPGVDRVEIRHDEANHASEAIPRRLGFTEIARGPLPDGPATSGEVGVEVVWRLHRPAPQDHRQGRPGHG